jgi:hypothetical protein
VLCVRVGVACVCSWCVVCCVRVLCVRVGAACVCAWCVVCCVRAPPESEDQVPCHRGFLEGQTRAEVQCQREVSLAFHERSVCVGTGINVTSTICNQNADME